MPRILITGTTGLVGSRLYEVMKEGTGYEVFGTSRSGGMYVDLRADLTSRQAIENIASAFNPQVVIHTAAIAKTDACESNREICSAVNVTATKNLLDLFPSALFVFFSTYAVYNTPEGNCDESCPVMPTNHYIRTKIEAESCVSRSGDHLILRPSVIFGFMKQERDTRNYFMQLLDNIRLAKVTRSPRDQFFNPVHVDVVADLVRTAIRKELHGTYNIGSNENISKYEFNLKVMEKFGFDRILLEGIDSGSLQVNRPGNGTISSRKIQQDLGYAVPSLDDMIELLYRSVKNGNGFHN
jgi:dTDP-4-dehydrorhamnose reductase